MGTIDRVVRAALGIALVFGALAAGAPIARAILGVAAVIMLGTAFVGFCPLYRLFGLSTCRQGPK
jgi:uncharacterized membrane protein YuzA (DUF378 family)